MIVIGLTGSIGMGKSTAANMLRAGGIPVHCSDEAVHALYKSSAIIAAIAEVFPAAYDAKTHSIDKTRLKKELGFNHEKLDALQEILHPAVVKMQQDFLRLQRANGIKIVALDIPLLFETGAQTRVDYTFCVTAPDFVQRQRVMARPGMTEEIFAFMLSRQMPNAEKRKRADFIIQTGQGLAQTRQELQDAVSTIKKKHWGNGHESNGPKPRQP